MAALSGLSFHRSEIHWREQKKECPIQKSNLGSTSSVWSICCSLGWTTQSDLAAQVNIVFLWGKKKCKDVDVNCFPD